jgi:hypothetical protein
MQPHNQLAVSRASEGVRHGADNTDAFDLLSTGLTDLLAELEGRWLSKGWCEMSSLRPGIDEGIVRRALTGRRSPLEILEWFGWHDGQLGPGEGVELAPSRFTPLSLEGAIWAGVTATALADRIVDQLAGDPSGAPTDSAFFWRESWLPLGHVGERWLAVDLATESEYVEVRSVEWGVEDFDSVRARSLCDLVRLWLDAPNEYWSWSPTQRMWEHDSRVLPEDMFGSRLF